MNSQIEKTPWSARLSVGGIIGGVVPLGLYGLSLIPPNNDIFFDHLGPVSAGVVLSTLMAAMALSISRSVLAWIAVGVCVADCCWLGFLWYSIAHMPFCMMEPSRLL